MLSLDPTVSDPQGLTLIVYTGIGYRKIDIAFEYFRSITLKVTPVNLFPDKYSVNRTIDLIHLTVRVFKNKIAIQLQQICFKVL